jgi:hypothetical protein
MIENKVTFIRHHKQGRTSIEKSMNSSKMIFSGESNVYTIGTIGPHHVVSTKLPLIGRSRTAQISTGSTTTRLLGTFQHVQHVFIIGCAGGVPHYTDATKHVRRGDIIVGYPNEEDYIYGNFGSFLKHTLRILFLQVFMKQNNLLKDMNLFQHVINQKVFNFIN